MSEPKPSPLHEVHVAEGAHLVAYAGWLMPLRYASDLAEHRAVRTAAGLFDLSHMGELRVTGPDAGSYLDHALVSELSTMTIGRAKYTMLCQPDGGIVDDLICYRLGETEYLIVANAANTEVVVAALTAAAAGFDVVVADESAETALLAVQGPAAVEIVAGLVDDAAAVRAMKYYSCLPVSFAGLPALLARTGYTGEDGFEVYLTSMDARAGWDAIRAAGAEHGLSLAGLAARDSLRLEAGMPLYGNELSTQITPYEAGLGRVVKLGKTAADGAPLPFIGREALATQAETTPARQLVGLKGLGRRAARAGYAVLAGTDPDQAAEAIGEITSGVPSPTLGYPIAMAYLPPRYASPGTIVGVDLRGTAEPFEVVALPFYTRPKEN